MFISYFRKLFWPHWRQLVRRPVCTIAAAAINQIHQITVLCVVKTLRIDPILWPTFVIILSTLKWVVEELTKFQQPIYWPKPYLEQHPLRRRRRLITTTDNVHKYTPLKFILCVIIINNNKKRKCWKYVRNP